MNRWWYRHVKRKEAQRHLRIKKAARIAMRNLRAEPERALHRANLLADYIDAVVTEKINARLEDQQ